MKKKIAYVLLTAAFSISCFFVGMNFNAKESEVKESETTRQIIEKACDHITYWEVTDDGLIFYDEDGNMYQWK